VRIGLRVFFLFLTAVSLGCITSAGPNRRPASNEEESFDSGQLITFLREILNASREPENKLFRVIKFPIREVNDLEAGFEDAFSAYQKRFEEARKLFDEFMLHLLKHPDEIENFRSVFSSGLTRIDRDELLNLCHSFPLSSGDLYNPMSGFTKFACQFSGKSFSERELREVLEQFPANPSGVRYDGSKGYHVYSNAILKRQVQTLTSSINTDLHMFSQIYNSMPDEIKDKFRVNHDSTDEKDKVEPFDLIANASVAYLIGKAYGTDDNDEPLNKIQISKLVQKALSRTLNMKPTMMTQFLDLPNMVVNRNDNTVSVFCANGSPSDKPLRLLKAEWYKGPTGTDIIENWKPTFNFTELLSKGVMKSDLVCSGTTYSFQFDPIEAETIPRPENLQFSPGQEINALMTVSLVREVNQGSIQIAQVLASALTGWTVEGEIAKVDTRKFLMSEFIKFDAYFPVMHAMDVNYFTIGTEFSLAVRLKKTVTDQSGVARALKLTILLPSGGEEAFLITMKPAELAQLLNMRYQQKPTPLFLMNNSCSSEKTLLAWSLVFRNALELRKASGQLTAISEVRDFPHVIGSKRSFGTSNLIETLSHSQYPLRSLEMLGEGKSVQEIVEFLGSPAPQGIVRSFLNWFANDPSNNNSFAPVYNIDHPKLMKTGGVRIFVTGSAIKGTDQY